MSKFLKALTGNTSCSDNMINNVASVRFAIDSKISTLELDKKRLKSIKARKNTQEVRKAEKALLEAYKNTSIMEYEPDTYIKTILSSQKSLLDAQNESKLDAQEISNIEEAIGELENLKENFPIETEHYVFLDVKE